MSQQRTTKLNRDEIAQAFAGDSKASIPHILSPNQLADILGLSVKTIYAWIAAGRLDGTFRKRGKHVLIWRDRAIAQIFNGPAWTTNDE